MISKIFFSKIIKNKPIVFLDRDGVINVRPREHEYVNTWSKFVFTPKIVDLLSSLQNKYQFIVISNQQGIAKGVTLATVFKEISKKMVVEFRKHNIEISAVYFCPHHVNDNCNCRKPKPGLILEALSDFSSDPLSCALIGDSDQDIEAGRLAGIKMNYRLKSNVISNADFARIISDLK